MPTMSHKVGYPTNPWLAKVMFVFNRLETGSDRTDFEDCIACQNMLPERKEHQSCEAYQHTRRQANASRALVHGLIAWHMRIN